MYKTTKILQTTDKHEVELSILYNMCYHAARLYNVGLHSIRQHFFNTNRYLSYNENYHICKQNENYSILLSDSAQSILRLADRNMKSFFQLLVLKQSGKYSEKLRLPKYKSKADIMVCPIQGRSCRIQKDGTVNIGLTKEFRELYGINKRCFTLTIPKNIQHIKGFEEIRIIPQYGGKQFSIEFIYTCNTTTEHQGNGYMGIDLGVSNFAACTCFSNSGTPSQFIIDGRKLKNINHYYNKQTSRLKSEYAKNKSIVSTDTKRMVRLMNGRNNRINEYFNLAVKQIIDTCNAQGISTIVIGYNKEQKQDVNTGIVNNQNLCYIPHYKFRRKLESACVEHGIAYISQEESYTSKASAIDCDFIPVFNPEDRGVYEFSGKRTHRGLYRSSDGTVLNADINGAVNILRKYFKERNENWEYQDSVRALSRCQCNRINCFTSPIL